MICFGACYLNCIMPDVGTMAEGVSYSIIIANLLVPLIERVTVPTPFGIVKKGGKSNE